MLGIERERELGCFKLGYCRRRWKGKTDRRSKMAARVSGGKRRGLCHTNEEERREYEKQRRRLRLEEKDGNRKIKIFRLYETCSKFGPIFLWFLNSEPDRFSLIPNI